MQLRPELTDHRPDHVVGKATPQQVAAQLLAKGVLIQVFIAPGLGQAGAVGALGAVNSLQRLVDNAVGNALLAQFLAQRQRRTRPELLAIAHPETSECFIIQIAGVLQASDDDLDGFGGQLLLAEQASYLALLRGRLARKRSARS